MLQQGKYCRLLTVLARARVLGAGGTVADVVLYSKANVSRALLSPRGLKAFEEVAQLATIDLMRDLQACTARADAPPVRAPAARARAPARPRARPRARVRTPLHPPGTALALARPRSAARVPPRSVATAPSLRAWYRRSCCADCARPACPCRSTRAWRCPTSATRPPAAPTRCSHSGVCRASP